MGISVTALVVSKSRGDEDEVGGRTRAPLGGGVTGLLGRCVILNLYHIFGQTAPSSREREGVGEKGPL